MAHPNRWQFIGTLFPIYLKHSFDQIVDNSIHSSLMLCDLNDHMLSIQNKKLFD